MTPAAGTHEIGSANGTLRLRTARAGMAAKVGHDLLLEFTRWRGQATVPPAGEDARIEVQVEVSSLAVIEGVGGVKPLSEDDKADIVKNALKVLEAGAHPSARFESDTVRRNGADGAEIEGTLSLRGASGPIRLSATGVETEGRSQWRAEGSLTQTAFGVKPYSAMLGALRLADEVRIEVELALPIR